MSVWITCSCRCLLSAFVILAAGCHVCMMHMRAHAMQVLDGQAVSETDRTAAAAYSTRQAQMPSADLESAAVPEQDTTLSPAASLRTGRAAAAALPSRASLPSSSQRGLQTLRTKSTGLRQKKSGDIGAVTRVTGQRTGSFELSTGKPLLCLPWRVPHDTLYSLYELRINAALPVCTES